MNDRTAIAVFGYKRPRHLEEVFDALTVAEGFSEYSVYIFIDGPRRSEETELGRATVSVAEQFCSNHKEQANLLVRSENIGLSRSILKGVDTVLSDHQSVIVLEDDIVIGRFALEYFRLALERYERNPVVASVSGYSHPPKRLRIPAEYPYDAYFLRRNSSWGWATWVHKWRDVDWSMDWWDGHRQERYLNRQVRRVAPDIPLMLDDQLFGRIDSWAVRYTLHHIRNGLVSLVPVQSQVRNIGFDGTGVHSGVSRKYTVALAGVPRAELLPEIVAEDPIISRKFSALYRRGLLRRVATRIRRAFR